MKFLIKLVIVGIIVLVAAIWYYSDKNPHAAKAKDEIKSAAADATQFVEDKIGTSNLSTDEIKDELRRTGRIVRRKAEEAGAAVVDATADARTTSAVKARLMKEQNLASLNISVSTTAGVVTLSGTSASPDDIRQAIKTTMETEGVHKVISTLQVK